MSETFNTVKNIICKQEYINAYSGIDYFIIGSFDNNIKFKGYTKCDISEGDIIICKFKKETNNIKDEEYFFKISKENIVIISNNIDIQKERIRKIAGSSEYVEYFNKFKYGDLFWMNIYTEYNNINNSEITLDKIDDIIYNLGKYIQNYEDMLLYNFNLELEKHNITFLTKQQKINLYNDTRFGINIDNWNKNKLYLLFNIDKFGIKTIIKIVDELIGNKLIEHIKARMKLNIIYRCYDKICICYDNINYFSLITGSFYQGDIKFSFRGFTQLVKELTDENIILNIKNCLYNKLLYEKEHYICKQIIECKQNNKCIMNEFDITDRQLENKIRNKDNTKTTIIKGIQIKDTNTEDTPIEQLESIRNIFKYPISCINGKAGTGKTTCIKFFIKFIKEFKLLKKCNVCFMAPTAAAKEKIKETIKYDDRGLLDGKEFSDNNFMTIHSFIHKTVNEFINTHLYTILIIDETSMLDIDTLYSFILKLKNITDFSIIFLGDTRQLPSVGLGDILNRLIKSKTIQTTELIKVLRIKNDNNNVIEKLLDTVIDGKYINNCIDNNFVCCQKVNNMCDNIIKTIEENKDSIIKNKTLIITPLKSTITKYTNIIRNIINVKNKDNIIEYNNKYIVGNKYKYGNCIDEILKSININEIEINNNIYRVGDKVMHIKNFNKEGLYNGLVGYISNIIEIVIKNKNKIIHIIIVNYSKIKCKNSLGECKDKECQCICDKCKSAMCQCNLFNYVSHEEYIKFLIPAYMITIHKSQGQEYDNIILLIDGESKLLNRNLLYTALSRAKKKIIIISEMNYINKAIDVTIKTKTLMDQMLKYYNDELLNNIYFEDYINIEDM